MLLKEILYFSARGSILKIREPHSVHVRLPLKTPTKAGTALIAGAGTGKAKLTDYSRGASSNPSHVWKMDIRAISADLPVPVCQNPKIDERMQKIGIPYNPSAFPVELLSIFKIEKREIKSYSFWIQPVCFLKILNLRHLVRSICDNIQPVMIINFLCLIWRTLKNASVHVLMKEKEIEASYLKDITSSTWNHSRKK